MGEPRQCNWKCQILCWFVCDDHTFGHNHSVRVGKNNKGSSAIPPTTKYYPNRLVHIALVIFQSHWTSWLFSFITGHWYPAPCGCFSTFHHTIFFKFACHVTYTQVQLLHIHIMALKSSPTTATQKGKWHSVYLQRWRTCDSEDHEFNDLVIGNDITGRCYWYVLSTSYDIIFVRGWPKRLCLLT